MGQNETPQGDPNTLNEATEQEILDALEDAEAAADAGEDATVEELPQLSPLEAALAAAEEFKTLAQRTRADLENYRRRTNKEREDLLRYGAERVLGDILNVMDDVERAREHAADGSPLAEGFQMLHANLASLLERHQVTEVPGVGAAFDPNLHNAIQRVESADVEAGQVVEVYQKGYRLHDRLLRPAMVAVSA